MKMSFLLILSSLFFFLTGCYVENASSEENKILVIASDYLEEADTVLFSDFCNKEKVRVAIKNIDANNLIGEIRNKKFDHGIDIIMMKSLYSVYNLQSVDLFHSIDHIQKENKAINQHISKGYKFVGVGIDPFVCASRTDTNVVVRNYDELKSISHFNTLNEEDLIPMLSHLMSKMNKVKCYEWIEALLKKETKIEKADRYQAKHIPVALTTLENYNSNFKNDSVLSKYTNLTYPNSSSSGTFYNLRTVCIAGQAQHFTLATSFINYYLLPKNNARLNGKLNTISITGGLNGIKLYRIDSKELMQYYVMIRRILSKLT